ncbi:MAG: hypothetical protein JWP25_4660 [Bradyrhizobium sp.]|nr:hypothetical protein [Bradyrhizobium sp.]
MKKDPDEPEGIFPYQTVGAMPKRKRFVQDKFCRSCGHDLPQRSNPIGIQLFYCEPNCAFDAAVHAAAKGYAAPAYIRTRRNYWLWLFGMSKGFYT